MIEKMKMMDKVVPTHLAVKVNGTHEVFYTELSGLTGGFGYEFKVWPKNGADKAVAMVIDEMENQSFDHGASWRRTSVNEIYKEDDLDMHRFFVVTFRVRDVG
jgi:hypothetical protein